MVCRLMGALLAGAVMAGAALAEDAEDPAASATAEAGVVLELYTSQGCIACPPVEALFATLADRSDVIALALHVDYWDYIGWRDRFAQPAFTDRQKNYARRSGSSTVYTPQMIIGGIDRVQGFRPMAVQDLLAKHSARGPQVNMTVEIVAGQLTVQAMADPPLGHEVSVQLVRYRPYERMRISSGENAGHESTYRNIVTAWIEIARWDGAGTATFHRAVDGDAPVVVILQQADHGPILGAMRLR